MNTTWSPRAEDGRVALDVTGLAPFVPAGTNGRFKKEVLRVGRWIHPGTGELLDFDLAFLEQLARDTNRWIALGNKVHFPAGPDCHEEDARDARSNLGFWSNFRVEGTRLVADVVVLDERVLPRVGLTIQDASPEIRWPARAATGEVLPAAIFHVAATPIPAIPGQSNFERLSRLAREVTVAKKKLKRPVVPPKETAKRPAAPGEALLALARSALGLAADVPEKAVVEALAQRLAPPVASPAGGDDALTRLTREVEAARQEATLARQLATEGRERSAAEKLLRDEQTVALARGASVAAGLPIPEDACKLARELFARNEDAAARELLSVHTARANDRRGFGLGRPVVEPHFATGDVATRLSRDAAERVLLEAHGYEVAQDEQGVNKRGPDGRAVKSRRKGAK